MIDNGLTCLHVATCWTTLKHTLTLCRNLSSAGFTPEERESFERLLLQKGFKDVFRDRHPEVEAYTYRNCPNNPTLCFSIGV